VADMIVVRCIPFPSINRVRIQNEVVMSVHVSPFDPEFSIKPIVAVELIVVGRIHS
jgi:hypothetical protein